ncbi:Uncharacterised protein [Klebsiella pneumoniae subsp. pneumoniae]|nr:Uncharacterised protein [Klebsiella pneumoniae subsp. pneumoniae]
MATATASSRAWIKRLTSRSAIAPGAISSEIDRIIPTDCSVADDGQGDHAQQAVVQQSAAQAAGFSLRWIEGVQQKIPPFETDNQRNHQCDRRRLPNIAEGYSQHIAEQDMVEMNIGLDRYVQHQSGAKHAGEDNPHDGIALESAVIVEKTGRHGAQQTGDKRADGEGDAR